MENNSQESKNKSTKKKTGTKASREMESRKKVFLILVAIVLILAVALVVLSLFNKDENVKTSNKINEEKSFQSYKLKETAISYEEESTIFDTKIENIGSELVPAGGFNIILLDKDGNELTSIGVYLKEMEPAEIIETKAVISEKIENIYDLKIVSDETIKTQGETSEEPVDENVEQPAE